MLDSFGRTIDYLRLSITDCCNLRCVYCMPPGGVQWTPHEDILRFEEIERLCRIMAGLGIRKIKVSGGEPLVRRDAAELVRRLKNLPGIEQVTMTSNGILLSDYLDALAASGLDAVNISLNSLDEEGFRRITRGEGLERVLDAIDRSLALGFRVKINFVALRGMNEGDIVKLAALAKHKNLAVRFIELMPLGAASSLATLQADEVMSLLEKEYGTPVPAAGSEGNGPAAYCRFPGFRGSIGFISALSRSFCEHCSRLRLTAAGTLKSCLASGPGLELGGLLRGGASDSEIGEAVTALAERKPRSHNFAGGADSAEHQSREMFRTGG